MDKVEVRAEWTLETVLGRNGFNSKSAQLKKILLARRSVLEKLLHMGYGHKRTVLDPQEKVLIDSCENRQTHISLEVTTHVSV